VSGNAEKVMPELTLTMLPASPLAHDGKHCLHGHQRGDEIEVHDGTEVIGADLVDRRLQSLAGVVHQSVDAAEGLAAKPADTSRVEHVTRSASAPTASER
jgi:hypothetical protein